MKSLSLFIHLHLISNTKCFICGNETDFIKHYHTTRLAHLIEFCADV